MLAAANGDVDLVLRDGGDHLPEVLAGLEELVDAAMGGNGLAILHIAASLRETPGGIYLIVAVMLRLAARTHPERVESYLEAAAALLSADNRRSVFHLDQDSVVVGALARAVVLGS